MFGSDVLEVAIGLSFVFLLASLVCTAAKEGIETLLNQRSGFLKQAVKELIEPTSNLKETELPKGAESEDRGVGKLLLRALMGLIDPSSKPKETELPEGPESWVRRFYEHPLINCLYFGAYDPKKKRGLPSYIPTSTFASTVLDLVVAHARDKAMTKLPKNLEPEKLAAETKRVIEAFTLRPADALATVQRSIEALPDGSLKRVLPILLAEAGPDLASVRAAVETWFDHSMDRVTGYYKRHSQELIFILAVAVTLALNINALTLGQSLVRDTALRKALVAKAELASKQPPTFGGTVSADAGASPASGIQGAVKQLTDLKLPVGWDEFEMPASFGGGISLLAGWLGTVLALSLGAPFWFDILNRVVLVRASLSPEAAAKREAALKPVGDKDKEPVHEG